MDYFSICSMAVGLAMDAFAVSVSDGALSKSVKIPYALKLSFFFGFFQLLMPVIGWLFGKLGESFINVVRVSGRYQPAECGGKNAVVPRKIDRELRELTVFVFIGKHVALGADQKRIRRIRYSVG